MHVHVSRRVTDMSDVSATCGPCHVVHTQLRTSNVKHIHTYMHTAMFFFHIYT